MKLVRFKVLTAENMKMALFWDVALRPDDGGSTSETSVNF
jgi:hypothetical protein